MAMADSRRQRIITLCGLYVAQGVPWGFMAITLPAFLSDKYEVGDDELGYLKGVILLPWSFKLLWAPLMDSFTIRSMGRRRPWIIGAELLMAATLLGLVGIKDLGQNIELLIWMYILHNIFASLQDVCTDALAVDILPAAEQGRMNGLMWGSKMVGYALGMTGLAYILEYWGLDACVMVQIAILLCIMLIPILILEREGEKRFPWSSGQAMGESGTRNVRDPRELFRDLKRAFSLTTTLVFIVFTLTKLFGSGINEVVTTSLYTQKLGWDHTEFSTVSGLYSLIPIILGAVLGGFLADRFGRRKILVAGFCGYAIVAMTFAALPDMWKQRWFATSYILAYQGLNVMASVGFLSMAMRISWTRSAATVFTTYMTLSNVSHVIGNGLAGPVRSLFKFGNESQTADMHSYELTFWFVGFLSLVPLLLLFYVKQDEVREAREAESASE
jgi:PAT family beta-lactamase induction signal transducer AmpG